MQDFGLVVVDDYASVIVIQSVGGLVQIVISFKMKLASMVEESFGEVKEIGEDELRE